MSVATRWHQNDVEVGRMVGRPEAPGGLLVCEVRDGVSGMHTECEDELPLNTANGTGSMVLEMFASWIVLCTVMSAL